MPAVVRLRRLVNTTVPIATMSMLRIVSRITGSLNASSRQSRRVSSGLSQHCFQLRLGEFLRLPHSWLARRHYPIHRAGSTTMPPRDPDEDEEDEDEEEEDRADEAPIVREPDED